MKVNEQQGMSKYETTAILNALNNTSVAVFAYYPQTKVIVVTEKACERYQCQKVYENMPQSFADDYVHIDDHEKFNEMYYAIDRGEPTATAIFHSHDLNFCNHVTLTTVSWGEDGEPIEALGIIEDMSDAYKSDNLVQKLQEILSQNIRGDDSVQEAVTLIADVISDAYRTIYHIWLEDFTYVSFQDEMNNNGASVGNRVPINVSNTELFVEKYVEPEFQAGVRAFFSFDSLEERLKHVNHIEHDYRRKKYGWTKAQFIVARRDEHGKATNVIFTVIDINDVMEQEEARKAIDFELLHDSLTKVYNRKAFEEMENRKSGVKENVGFAIIDIDNFKVVNDTFGHDMGDKVLAETAELISNHLRRDDMIFRLGGDEFAVLLQGCTKSAWGTLCEKQHRVHEYLNQILEDMSVTLSIGVAITEDGYSEELFKQADSMLYEVKRRGRAGAAMIDTANNRKSYWSDDNLSFKARNVLAFNNTGLYRIEYPLDASIPPRFFCGEMTRELFDFGKDLTPEECYEKWSSNIEPSYIDVMHETREILLQGGQAECTYQWNHPTHGLIYIRTGGAGEVVDDIQILHGYHHSMEGTQIVDRNDDSQLLNDSMSAIYFCSYYIDIDNDSFYVKKSAPGEKYMELQRDKATDAFRQFLETLVTKDYQAVMTEFTDLKTIRERLKGEVHLDCEYKSCTEKGWCRATFFPVKYNSEGVLTHVLFMVTSLDERRARQARLGLENRKSIEALYNNVPCGLIMYEWDGIKLKTIHISSYYEKEYGYTLNSNDDGTRGPDFKRVHPDDLADYQKAINKALNETHELHYEYRVWNNGKRAYTWTRIDATSKVQPDGTSLVYALYTDVTDRRVVMDDYDDRLAAALGVVENSIVVGQWNLSENTAELFKADDMMMEFLDGVHTFDERIQRGLNFVVGDGDRAKFAETFNREALLDKANQGQTQLSMEYLLRVPGHHTIWIETGVNMVKNPLTGEITAISYSRNVQQARICSLIMKHTLDADYIRNVVVLADTGEFYTIDTTQGFDNWESNFWGCINNAIIKLVDDTPEHLAKMLSREVIMSHLEKNDEYTYSFNTSYYGEDSRLQVRFSNLLKDQSMILVSVQNITDTVLLEKYRHDSEHDSLTDLYNRKTVFRKCRELIDEHPDDELVMVHFDIRHFKLYNSFFGEEAGDRLLCDIAAMFNWIGKDYESIVYGRIEADVFCSCFPFDAEVYRKHVNKVIDVLKDYRDDFLIEPAIGVYFVTDRSMTAETMFTRATLAAKSLKHGAPLATVVYNEELERKLNMEQQVLNDMQTAIDEEQFEIYLQPKYCLKTGKPVAAEALVRWNHPLKGMIMPGVFIPIFERYGLITSLDRYVWEQTCAFLHKRRAEGKSISPISVNVSRLSMYSKSTVEFLKGLVEKYNIAPEYLEIELTESAYIDDDGEMKNQMRALREIGFKIHLDDFGSGYSSLNALRELPVDILKLDMKFLAMDKNDKRGRQILTSIVNMAKLLDLRIIAEGVEIQEQADFLSKIGCEYAQGYLFARPMPTDEYEAMIDEIE